MTHTTAVEATVALAVTAARHAEDARQTAQWTADGAALARAVAVADLVEVLGSQTAAAEALGITQPNVSALSAKARAAADPAAFDVIRVAADHTDYDAEDVGKLAVQRDGQFEQFVADLDQARAWVFSCTGVAGLELIAANNYFSGDRWVVTR